MRISDWSSDVCSSDLKSRGSFVHSGLISIVGRPNVGKSSLMNALVGRKVSIVSHKPQTTRHRIQGVVNRPEGQIVFVDTPGLHQRETRRLNRAMNEQADRKSTRLNSSQ